MRGAGYFRGNPVQHGEGVFRGYPTQYGDGYFRGMPYQWGMGRNFPPYRNIQDGEGIGQFFQSILRYVLPIVTPIAARTASTFINSTANQMSSGKSLAQAAKHSIAPTLNEAIDATSGAITSRLQNGRGRKRKRNRVRRHKKAKKSRRTHHKKRTIRFLNKSPQVGFGKRKRGKGRKKKRHSTKRYKKASRFPFMKTNF